MAIRSSLTVKKGAFPTLFLHDPFSFLDRLAAVKRAETRQCPICSEHIPVRLLEAHCDLETQRTEEVIRAVGSLEVYGDSVDGYEPVYPSHVLPLSRFTLFMCRTQFSRARRSAARAQKAFSRSSSGPGSAPQDTTARTEGMIKTVKRRRKQRYHRLREMIQSSNDDARPYSGRGEGGVGEIVCPVCLERVFGDPDVTEAHVDACLIHAMPSAREQTEIDIGGPSRTRVTDGVNLIGLMIHPSLDYHSTIEPSFCSLGFPC
jgi:hypothetical protein